MGLNGILNVNKPPACTSFSIVAKVRRLAGERTVGHAGTLDPMATGVLPVCLGQATRVTEYILNYPKEYIAVIELGASTDTFDGEGRVLECNNPGNVTFQSVQQALQSFLGNINQLPPSYSAVKIKGVPSYKLARAGKEVPLTPRKVRIGCIDALEFNSPYLKIKVQCSKGTYIRSLANDLGRMLGCGAYLKDLVRTAVGPFKISDAVTLERIQEAVDDGTLNSLLIPMDCPLRGWQEQHLGEDSAISVLQGRDIPLKGTDPVKSAYCRAYNSAGNLLAIMKFVPETGLWHPEKVFNLP